MADRLQSLKNHFSASSVTKGSCMCGAINYEFKGMFAANRYLTITPSFRIQLTRLPFLTGEPNATALCHCVDCHKWVCIVE